MATNRFARADLEGKLLMLDDDMNMSALPDTNILKAIITMEDKIDLGMSKTHPNRDSQTEAKGTTKQGGQAQQT